MDIQVQVEELIMLLAGPLLNSYFPVTSVLINETERIRCSHVHLIRLNITSKKNELYSTKHFSLEKII
jgi:hypothetical protein